MNPLLVTMQGPDQISIANLSNFEAGLAFLGLLHRMSPNLTFGQLAAQVDGGPETMAGWFTDLSHAVGRVKDGIGDVLKDTANSIGGGAGDAVRLVTNEKVIDGASRLGTAYATDGGSEGVRNLLGGGGSSGNSGVDSIISFISSLGQSFKSKAVAAANVNEGGILSSPSAPWLIGGMVLVGILLLRGRR